MVNQKGTCRAHTSDKGRTPTSAKRGGQYGEQVENEMMKGEDR